MNSMRAQFRRCSFNKTDFVPASGFAEFDDGVVSIQMGYRLRGRDAFQVLNDATESVAELLGIGSLRRTFDHVIFCFAWGTTYGRKGTEWLAFGLVNGYTSTFNSGRCASLTYLMHEIGHNLGLLHSADDFIGDPYGDTTGVVSFIVFYCTVKEHVSQLQRFGLLHVSFPFADSVDGIQVSESACISDGRKQSKIAHIVSLLCSSISQ